MRGGGVGVKPPEPLRIEKQFFLSVKQKLPKPHGPLSSREGSDH